MNNTFCKTCHRIPSQCVCSKQTKPLSDEEICLLWKTSQEDGVGMSLGYTTQEHYFARLIEERHGIK